MEGGSRVCPSSLHALGFLLILLTISANVKTSSATAKGDPHSVKPSTEFIRTSCDMTRYPQLCFKSLSSHATDIQKSPKHLAQVALRVSLEAARSTSAMLLKLPAGRHLKPREAGATSDCIKTVGDSIDQLQQSLKEMGRLSGPEFQMRMNNIKTWVTAAMTDDDTCMDGFAGKAMDGEVKAMVRSRIVHVARLTSNALAFISNLPASSNQDKSP
ncbi:hypothetical protein ACLOJK_033427 [Asimina triloba]